MGIALAINFTAVLSAARMPIGTLIQTMVGGTDACGNGTVSWEDNVGGLAQGAQHMQFTAADKGMA
jgi:uncharacterized 2Fe-2S/4Fe-4S cluster protein (DUF4445 family)